MGKESIGIVKTHYYHLSEDLVLENGHRIADVTIAYETYGH